MRMILVLVVVILAGYLRGANALTSTVAPTLLSIDDVKLYSYFCLTQEMSLCLGLSTSDLDPVYDPVNLYYLQVKPRAANELKGLDYQKLRWAVDRTNGIIRLSNFTELCLAKELSSTATPGNAVIRPCGQDSSLQTFDLSSFLTNVNEEGQIRLQNNPTQCLTMMQCKRLSMGYCDPTTKIAFTGGTIVPDAQRGAWVTFMPCVQADTTGYKSQSFRQTIDCAPGCSPFMMLGGLDVNTCDPECNNLACNWDNGACTTTAPTPPTPRPSGSPSKTPSRAPTVSRPTRSPSTSKPSQNPSKVPTTSVPSQAPSRSPTKSPSTSRPSTTPSIAPTRAPTHRPSQSPSKHPTTSKPSRSPSRAPSKGPETTHPTNSPSQAPTVRPSEAPSQAPTRSPTANVTILFAAIVQQGLPWWIWIVVGLIIMLMFCCCGMIFLMYDRRRRRREKEELEKRLARQKDVESGLDMSLIMPSPIKADRSSRDVSPIPMKMRELSIEAPLPPPNPPREDSSSLIKVPLDSPTTAARRLGLPLPERDRGPVGLLWGGSNEDSFQELTSERSILKHKSERLMRNEVADALNQRSMTMPLEEIHEYDAEDNDMADDYFALPAPSNGPGDGEGEFMEQQSGGRPVLVEGMSIKELKSFIVDQGGDLAGCTDKDQLVARAKELT